MAQDDNEKKVTDQQIEDQSVVQNESVENDGNVDTSLEKEVEEEATSDEVEVKEKPKKKKEKAAEEVISTDSVKEEKVEVKLEEPSDEVSETESDESQPVPIDEAEPSAEEKQNEAEEPVSVENKNSKKTPEKEEVVEEKEEDSESDEDDDSGNVEHQLDYSHYSKAQLVQVLESEIKDSDMYQVGKILKEIKPAYDEIYHSERQNSYKKYIEEGGEKDGFEYKNDDLDERFNKAYTTLKDKRHDFYHDQEKQKDKNLISKQAILEKLRAIVDSDETNASLKDLKDIQDGWKNTGPVAPQHLKSLWANYNALIDRYYDQRSIYFELKELDRKKNLESKMELCEKAEALEKEENIKEAIKALNELHEEFKHIGPVPKDDQELVWKRFKTASDAVYSKRKDFFDHLKEELKVNQIAKEALAEKAHVFIDFNSERISDWNQKTKDILALQKEWEAIGGLPRDTAKDINKKFWAAFKTFFNHKGQFFKHIEKARQENLKLKEELVQKAEELKDVEDFGKTAELFKDLQKQWKDIGPVPEKVRNDIYNKFKATCDYFFGRRRQNDNKQEKEFVINLKKKKEICEEIEKMTVTKEIDVDRIDEILELWAGIGFVPRNDIKSIQQRFVKAVSEAVDLSGLDEEETQLLKFTAQFNKLKQGPNSNRIIQKKENSLRRQIAKLENDIDLWKNNLDFFAKSKTADKLKAEFNEKIEKAAKELSLLEEQLRAISNF